MEPVLCYIDDGFAYFTTQPLKEQWGDDWNDAPYDCNAEPPYSAKNGEYDIIIVGYKHPVYDTPANNFGFNCKYSVEMINNKAVAWLADYWHSKLPPIFAGTTLGDFLHMIRDTGGHAGVLE